MAHKERMKKIRAQVDVLTMTATPIPRTLEMALTGIRQMSTIDTPPEDRQPVLTFVGSFDEDLALGAVRRELLREGQVFWVHNRVATIDRQVRRLREQLPERADRGRPRPDGRGRSSSGRWSGSGSARPTCWCAPTIIESGLDVPNANTWSWTARDMLGLAQLYQLRGRVGRARERAFAYLFFPRAARDDRGGARAAGHDRAAPGARQRVPDRDARPGDPRGGQPAGRRAERPHRGGRVRRVRADPAGVGRGAPRRAGRPEERSSASTCR